MKGRIKTNKYLQSRKQHMSMCHPDDKGSKCKPLDYSYMERIPIKNTTGSMSVKRGFRAKVDEYTNYKFINIAEEREIFNRESDEDEYDPWSSISPIGNGSYIRNFFHVLSVLN